MVYWRFLFSPLLQISHWDHVDGILEWGHVEAVWKGSGDGFAVAEGPGVQRVRILLRRLSRRLSPLFDRLVLGGSQLNSIPDCIGRLPNLIVYGIFKICYLSSILSTLPDSLLLSQNQLTSIPDSIGLLSNLTVYDIRFVVWFWCSSLSSIDSVSKAISWAPFRTLLASWPTWPSMAFPLTFDF